MSDFDDTIQDHEVLYQALQPAAWCMYGRDEAEVEMIGQLRALDRIRRRLRSGRYRWLDIAWYGVEPFAGLPVLRELAVATRALAAEFGCGYGSCIVTNGMALSVPVARQLRDDLGVYDIELLLAGWADDSDADKLSMIFHNLGEVARVCDLSVGIGLGVRLPAFEEQAPGLLASME